MARIKATTTSANASQIVSSANVVERTGISLTGTIGIVRLQEWAPAWFYSALNWLGKSYVDANNTEQAFTNYMYGSDVDPYAQLGNTRLFFIALQDDVFVLSIAPNLTSTAQQSTITRYPKSDQGILAMYNALAASPIFGSLKILYIPGRYASNVFAAEDLVSHPVTIRQPAFASSSRARRSAQVVPVEDFLATHNEQIYDPDPQTSRLSPRWYTT